MPSINWNQLRAQPKSSFRIITNASWLTLKTIVFWPFTTSVISIRNAIARAWLGTIFMINPSVVYSAPEKHSTQQIQISESSAFIIPTTEPSSLARKDAVVIFVHGGGMMIGHPLQYLDMYKRWVEKAKDLGKDIAVIALQYPLSPTKKWPAQRESLLALYRWALSNEISPSCIVFAGDSAGCDINYLTLLHMRDYEPALPPPSCVVSLSPWLDWTGDQTIGEPSDSDFMFYYDVSCPILNDTLRPTHLPFDTPEISALLAPDVSRLPPQLILYSKTEILGSDSSRWIERCQAAGGDVNVFAASGEMHTFAVGWPVAGRAMEETCDNMTLQYIMKHAC